MTPSRLPGALLLNSTPASRLNGISVTIGVWNDPNGDGNPNDAVLLGSVTGTIAKANTDTFISYPLPTSVTIATGSFFVGYMSAGSDAIFDRSSRSIPYFAGQDTSSPVGKSWFATMNGPPVDFVNLGRNKYLFTTEELGTPGNWMIRAVGSGPVN